MTVRNITFPCMTMRVRKYTCVYPHTESWIFQGGKSACAARKTNTRFSPVTRSMTNETVRLYSLGILEARFRILPGLIPTLRAAA